MIRVFVSDVNSQECQREGGRQNTFSKTYRGRKFVDYFDKNIKKVFFNEIHTPLYKKNFSKPRAPQVLKNDFYKEGYMHLLLIGAIGFGQRISLFSGLH